MGAACILTFHRLVREPVRAHDVSWAAFTALLDRIAERGPPHRADLEPPTGSHVVLTFDDGTEDHLAAARELARRGLRGIFFVPPAELGTPGRLTSGELRALYELGHVVGAHAFRHRPLGALTCEQVDAEVRLARDALEDIVAADVRWFAPPGGVASPYLVERLVRHGFAASRSMRWGVYRLPDERWAVPCVPVTQLTLARGWVAAALDRFQLPPAMRTVWIGKRALPPGVRGPLRRALGARAGGRA